MGGKGRVRVRVREEKGMEGMRVEEDDGMEGWRIVGVRCKG